MEAPLADVSERAVLHHATLDGPLIVDEYRALAGKAGLRTDVDADLVVDLLIGGLLNHLLVTGTVPTHGDAEQVAEILLAGLRVG